MGFTSNLWSSQCDDASQVALHSALYGFLHRSHGKFKYPSSLKALAAFLLAVNPLAVFNPGASGPLLWQVHLQQTWCQRALVIDSAASSALLDAIAEEAKSRLKDLNSQELASTTLQPPSPPPPPPGGGGGGNGSSDDDSIFLRRLDVEERNQVLDDWEARTRVYVQDNDEILVEKHTSALETLDALRTFITSQNASLSKRELLGLCNTKGNILVIVSLDQGKEAITCSHFAVSPRELNDEQESGALVCMLTTELVKYAATLEAKLPLQIEHSNIQNIFGTAAQADNDDDLFDDLYDDPVEKRYDPKGGGAFTEQMFRDCYGVEWQTYWDSAERVEHRIDVDGEAYTEQEFRDYYDDEWQHHWDKAEPWEGGWTRQEEERTDQNDDGVLTALIFKDCYGAELQKFWNASDLVERRIDPIDGGAFSEDEFKEYYGDEWQQHWDSAKPV